MHLRRTQHGHENGFAGNLVVYGLVQSRDGTDAVPSWDLRFFPLFFFLGSEKTWTSCPKWNPKAPGFPS